MRPPRRAIIEPRSAGQSTPASPRHASRRRAVIPYDAAPPATSATGDSRHSASPLLPCYHRRGRAAFHGWAARNQSHAAVPQRAKHTAKGRPLIKSPACINEVQRVMTNQDQILDYLKQIAPRDATNAEISAHTAIKPHQQVFQITQKLYKSGAIKESRGDGEWKFWIGSNPSLISPLRKPESAGAAPSSAAFEEQARRVMSQYFGVSLSIGKVTGVPKGFDLVSPDKQVVGDAKFYTMVNGVGLPPAKFATISEYVWLLEKVVATQKFIVFGNDRRVPEEWLTRYGRLVSGVEFYYLHPSDAVERLQVGQHGP
jgi:hypothetical protein